MAVISLKALWLASLQLQFCFVALAEATTRRQKSQQADSQKILALKQLEITDRQGHVLQMQPPFLAALPLAAPKYLVDIPPNTQQVTVTASCGAHASIRIGNSAAKAGVPVTVPMSLRSTSTTARILCRYMKQNIAFSVEFREHVNLAAVNLTLMLLGNGGVVKQPSSSTFVVEATTNSVQILTKYDDTRLGLDLVTQDGQRFVLGNYVASPPLVVPANGTSEMSLVLYNPAASKQRRNFDLSMRRFIAPVIVTTSPPQIHRIPSMVAIECGYFVAALVIGCIVAVALIRGVCEAFGLGTPRFASPAMRSLMLFLQFVALGSLPLEPCVLTDFAGALRWVAVFPPPDSLWQFLVKRSRGPSWLGSVSDSRIDSTEAAISLSCSAAILGFLIALHVLVLARLLLGGCCSRRYTLPHRLRLGGWEARCLLLLAYPISCASLLLLLRVFQAPPPFGTTVVWTICAACSLTVLVGVALAAECAVSRALSGRLVTWVFEAGSRAGKMEDGDLDETGYFCDATCDQLSTVSAERSCCGAFISHRWGTTVADIQPIELEQTLSERQATARLLAAKDDLEDVAAEADRTVEVEVIATLRPGALCQPFYCEVGRATNVPWLRAQLDAPALLRLHQEVDSQLHDLSTSLRVSVSQLQGPVTCGWLSFCFDGLHWPHLPPLELIARVLLGCLTALATAWPASRAPALFASSFLAGALFIFIFFHTPCTTVTENALLLLAYLGLALVAFELSAYTAGVFSLEVCSWVVLITVALVSLPLLAYAVLASVSLFAAAACPSVSEEELESYEQNNVDLSLRGPQDAWLLIMPASCSVPVSDAFVHTRDNPDGSAHVFITEKMGKGKGSRPRLEFPVLDYLAPTEKLEVPRVVLIGPSQNRAEALGGYRSEAIYGDEDPLLVLSDFLRRCSLPADHIPAITREVVDLLRKRSRPNHILVVNLMEAPRARLFDGGDAADGHVSGDSEEERETLMGTNRGYTNRVKDLRKVAFDDGYDG